MLGGASFVWHVEVNLVCWHRRSQDFLKGGSHCVKQRVLAFSRFLVVFCILLSDLRLSLLLWAMHVVKEKKIVYFSGLFRVLLAFHVR